MGPACELTRAFEIRGGVRTDPDHCAVIVIRASARHPWSPRAALAMASAKLPVPFDRGTHRFIHQLHTAWAKNAPLSTYDKLRDQILADHDSTEARLVTLSFVAKVAYPEKIKCDEKWRQFSAIAEAVELNTKKRKRAQQNQTNKLRNLTLIAALWSADLVGHCGWTSAGQSQLNLIRACAIQYPNFNRDFLPRLNLVLLNRHREALLTGRAKNLYEAPLQPHRAFDLDIIQSVTTESCALTCWIESVDGTVPVDQYGTLLRDLRPDHFRLYLLRYDEYGILTARGEDGSRHHNSSSPANQTSSPASGLQYSTSESKEEANGRSVRASKSPGGMAFASVATTSMNEPYIPLPPSSCSSEHISQIQETPCGRNSSLLGHAAPRDDAVDDCITPGGFTPDHTVAGFETSGLIQPAQSSIDVLPETPGSNIDPTCVAYDTIHTLSSTLHHTEDSHQGHDLNDWTPHWSEFCNSTPQHFGTDDGRICGAGLTNQTRDGSQSSRSQSDLDSRLIMQSSTANTSQGSSSCHTPQSSTSSDFIENCNEVGYVAGSSTSDHNKVGCLAPNPRQKILDWQVQHDLTGNPRMGVDSEQNMGPDLQVFTQRLSCSHPQTLEDKLRARHHSLLARYLAEIEASSLEHSSSPEDLHRLDIRHQWLNSSTRWAKIATKKGGPLPYGSASSEVDAEVLYLTSNEFLQAADEGIIFTKPVVIKEQFLDSGLHTIESIIRSLQGLSSSSAVDVNTPSHEPTRSIALQEFIKHVNGDRQHEGINALNLRNFTKSHTPLFTMIPRFRLLETLVDRTQNVSTGKRVEAQVIDVASCISFNVLGLKGAFSGAHVDSLSGTWVRILEGIKLWMIVPPQEMDWSTFSTEGSLWEPRGRERLILLEQDDVLFLPPGANIVHAVHSPTDCLMEGGMIWDESNIVSILRTLHWIGRNQRSTNEAIAFQLPQIVQELTNLVHEHPDRFRGSFRHEEFLESFHQALNDLKSLGCPCLPQECGSGTCVCFLEQRRCTAWCSSHPQIDLNVYCMQEPCSDGERSPESPESPGSTEGTLSDEDYETDGDVDDL